MSKQDLAVIAYKATGRIEISEGERAFTIEAVNVDAFMEALRQAHAQAIYNRDTEVAIRDVSDGKITKSI